MNRSLRGHLLAVFTCCVWGSTFICTKTLLGALEPSAILLIRFLIGILVLALLDPRPMRYLGAKGELLCLGAGFFGLALYYQFENLSLVYASASLVSVIISTAPFFVAICSWLFLKTKRPGMYFYIGFLLSIIGISLLSFTQSGGLSATGMGILMCLGAAFAWGPYSVLIKLTEGLGYSTVQISRRVFIYGVLCMLPGIIMGKTVFPLEAILRPQVLMSLLFLGVIASAICFVTWNKAMEDIGTVASSVYIYLSPVVTVVLSIPVLHERLTLQGIAGIALTLLGLVLSER